MNSTTLHQLQLGAVELSASDLQRSAEYYQTVLGMQLRQQGASRLVLGSAERDLLVLRQAGQGPAAQRVTGLYHFALLLPSRADLGSFLAHLLDMGVQPGAGDHLVSEALYLSDPDGHGIEVYTDRPRSEWTYVGAQVQMTTNPLDGNGLLELARSRPWQGLPAGTGMGHFHLRVADQQQAADFYGKVVGLETMTALPGASFMAADGYHHHLGLNTWQSRGARAPTGDVPGLKMLNWTLSADQLGGLTQRLTAAAWPFEQSGNTVTFKDPSGNASRFTAI